ncbi:MAG: hypothetical protein IJG18_11150 [Kiritimatiellae bacterium]|nr:hypothetical protein [Kiritimatiellia bacterium]
MMMFLVIGAYYTIFVRRVRNFMVRIAIFLNAAKSFSIGTAWARARRIGFAIYVGRHALERNTMLQRRRNQQNQQGQT